MRLRGGFDEEVGNTPLTKLAGRRRRLAARCRGRRFLNRGGSVKDRAALFIILDAEERGVLRPRRGKNGTRGLSPGQF